MNTKIIILTCVILLILANNAKGGTSYDDLKSCLQEYCFNEKEICENNEGCLDVI